MRFALITYCRREDGHPGGVPKWAWYLKRALDEGGHTVRHYAWRDYPAWRRHDDAPEHEKARQLCAYLMRDADLPQGYDHIIADGFWAIGLPDDAPVTVVCHGTWAGLAAACGGVDRELIAAQGEAYRRFPVVAVSPAAARQVARYHGARAAAIIPNGVDLSVFRPAARRPNDRPVVLYAGRGYAKGEDIVREVARLLDGAVSIEYLDAPLGMEARAFQRGDVLLLPSRHEGDSYALKEALACGLPAAASTVGALEDERSREMGEVAAGFEPADYCAALERVLANRGGYQPRRWAEKQARFEVFAEQWMRYLGVATETAGVPGQAV
jgi:glycosyltransferase involved in cell wall biosynthesis